MSTVRDIFSISIFELTEEEFRERLRPTAEAVIKEKFAKGGYFTYYDPAVCPTSAHTVHEYRDRKELVWIDHNWKEHFVKIV